MLQKEKEKDLAQKLRCSEICPRGALVSLAPLPVEDDVSVGALLARVSMRLTAFYR